MKFSNVFMMGLALAASSALASTYYVAPTGKDSNAGSKSSPFATLNKANAVVNAGDTVWIRGGTYMHTDTSFAKNDKMFAGIYLTKSGKSDNNRIHYLAYPGEKPVFDFSKMPIANGTNNVRYTSGFLIQAQYIHLKGFEVKNVPMKGESNVGVYVSRSKHIFLEQIDSHHNGGSGFFVNERGTGSGGGHLFLNCDSHDNYDPNGRQGDGQNADGFGVHYQTSGDTTKFIGCRAWWNSDDGWDFISQEFPVVIENSWAMGHGYSNYGTGKPKDGNGNGFKAGSSKTGIRHTIRNCVAWKNKASGFYANHSSGGNDWFNNTAYMNGTAFNMWASTWDANDNRTDGVILKGDKAHVMKNNIAFPNKTAYIGGDYASGEYNTWNLNITPKESDFLSVEDPSMTVTGRELGPLGGALGPRQADGSLPDVDFLKLAKNSQMIDRGVNVKLPYEGKAPDLGAYEYATKTTPTVNPGEKTPGENNSGETTPTEVSNGQTIVNDRFWKDTDGNFIYSQGGGVLQVGETFYWYGVKYKGAVTYAANPTGKNSDTGFEGVTCYSSKDLVNWKYEGIVLKPDQIGGGWFGRIGVVYNAKTKKYVLAGQGSSPSWEFGEYFATSDSPTGPFKFARVQLESEMTFFVNNNTGDQTLFQDDDGKAYVIASNVKGRTNLYAAPLRESDFLEIDGSRTVNIHKSRVGGREGNAMFKHDGVYYFCSSDLHGWNTSQTYCMSATNILGPYSEEFVLEGTQHDFSHVTQTGFFVMVNGTKGSFVVNAGDRWSDFAGNGLGFNQWLPISFESGKPVFHSLSEWNINVKEGTWSVGANNNYCLNQTFEADRVGQTTLTGWKLDKADANNINSTSKKRTGRWGVYLTDSKTLSQTLTVPNGKYTLSAYVQSSGGQSSAKMFAKDFGGTEQNASIVSAGSNWVKKTVENISVTNGKITIGFSTAGSSSQWIAVDDIELIRSGKSYKVKTSAGIGGKIVQNISGSEIQEGSNVTFSAEPLDGWQLSSWSGDASGSSQEVTIENLNKDVTLGANFQFIGKDSLKYEAENTIFNQTIFEDKHSGFSGNGYANLDNVVGSSITFALCLPEGKDRKVKLTFANGAADNRPVRILVNDSVQVEQLDLNPTGDWTVWADAEVLLSIPAGVNTLTISSLTESGAPNIDKIEFEEDRTAVRTVHRASRPQANSSRKAFTVDGKIFKNRGNSPKIKAYFR